MELLVEVSLVDLSQELNHTHSKDTKWLPAVAILSLMCVVVLDTLCVLFFLRHLQFMSNELLNNTFIEVE